MQQIFNLTPEQSEKALAVIAEMKESNLSISPFKNGAINLYIVKDGTQEAEDRKNMPDAILGPIDYNGEQYLITAK